MQRIGFAGGAAFGLAAVVAAAGCATTTGTPVPGSANDAASSSAPTAAPATPTGTPVGAAVMKVVGGGGPVTIRYRINGGEQQTETNVTLPWEKQFPVYEKLDTEVSAEGGDAMLACTITLDGDKLVSYVNDVRPRCTFAYWG